jgi:hypothetical protein
MNRRRAPRWEMQDDIHTEQIDATWVEFRDFGQYMAKFS